MKTIDTYILEKFKITKDIVIDNDTDEEYILNLLMTLSVSKNHDLKVFFSNWIDIKKVKLISIYTTENAEKNTKEELKKLPEEVRVKVQLVSFNDYMKKFYEYISSGGTDETYGKVVVTYSDNGILIQQEGKYDYLVVKRKTLNDSKFI